MRHICEFALENNKETTGALRFMQFSEFTQESDKAQAIEVKLDAEGSRDDQGLIGTLYMRKKRTKGKPSKVTVIVEYEAE